MIAFDTQPRIQVELARPEDEPALRRLLREAPMPGRVKLSLEREPDYFFAADVEGETSHVVIARDTRLEEIVGIGSRSVRPRYVNGRLTRIGYLSQLRVAERCRGQRRILVEGYETLDRTRCAEEASFDLTTILADNTTARRLLTAG